MLFEFNAWYAYVLITMCTLYINDMRSITIIKYVLVKYNINNIVSINLKYLYLKRTLLNLYCYLS